MQKKIEAKGRNIVEVFELVYMYSNASAFE